MASVDPDAMPKSKVSGWYLVTSPATITFAPVDSVKKEIKKATSKDITDKVVQLKPKRKKNVKKAKKKV